MDDVQNTKELLLDRLEKTDNKSSLLRAPELRELYAKIKDQPDDKKAEYGQAVNELKQELEAKIASFATSTAKLKPIDVTAPFDPNTKLPDLLPTENGTIHPITNELNKVLDIFARMGFEAVESRQIDDDYHVFESLNFPIGHPARDDWDTFMTNEGLVAPPHTSTMQNRMLKERKKDLENGKNISVVVPGRVFRNEDLDARHEHTFTQIEGVLVDKKINVGNLIATLKTFLEEYYEQKIETRITPFYFPFTEPSFEFSLSCPFCTENEDCKVCSNEHWVELLGCGMIHPNVLKMADIDPETYTGFAWGFGLERLVMMKHDIEDIRHFNSGKLKFLRQF